MLRRLPTSIYVAWVCVLVILIACAAYKIQSRRRINAVHTHGVGETGKQGRGLLDDGNLKKKNTTEVRLQCYYVAAVIVRQ